MRCHTLDMNTHSALRPVVAAASVFALLSGCSLLGDGPKWGAKRDAEKPAIVVPTLPEPVPTHRFEIDATTDTPPSSSSSDAGDHDPSPVTPTPTRTPSGG